MRTKQFYTTIEGRELVIPIVELENFAEFADIIPKGNISVKTNLTENTLHLAFDKPGRFSLSFKTKSGDIKNIRISVFKEKEVFLIPVLSCNYHEGWDPSLHDRFPHPECCGKDKNNNAFIHVKNMEKLFHKNNLPITWLIDSKTAREQKDFFVNGINKYNDEIALMPPSYSHFNSVNYNLKKTYKETLELCRENLSALEEVFNQKIISLGIDQFIGSVGTNFVKAAAELGIKALWGIGFDHGTCDTSMFHFGCPWNAYKPSKNNFRIPGKEPYPLWIFQWTFRDLISTARTPGGQSGSVMFSTDVDDIIACNVIKHQKNYYHKLIGEVLKNAAHNDFIEITIHQEDHDSWRAEGLQYYDEFFSNLPEGLTPATLGEAAEWLDIKYPKNKQPEQLLILEDSLICKDSVEFIHADVKKPGDWPIEPEVYPPHAFYYDVNCQIIFEKGKHTQQEISSLQRNQTFQGNQTLYRYINYSSDLQIPENGAYPLEDVNTINQKDIPERLRNIFEK